MDDDLGAPVAHALEILEVLRRCPQRVNQVGLMLDWSAIRIVEDTPGGIELWSHWGAIVARDRGFATPADRERFLAEARAFLPSSARGLFA